MELVPRIRKHNMWTRYTPLQRLHSESVWINGPRFLYQSNTEMSENVIYNLLHKFGKIGSSCLNSITKHQEYQIFIKWNNYFLLDKLVKHIAALMKFKKIWLLKTQNKGKENCCKKLSVEDLNKAEFEIYRKVQLDSFATEFGNLLNNQPITINIKFYHLPQFLSRILSELVTEYKNQTYRSIANIKLFSVSLTRYQSWLP